MVHLDLFFLGSAHATLDGQTIHFRSRRERALLAYLAVEADRFHERSALVGLFWADMPESGALGNLRQTLARLRHAIGDERATPPFLETSRRGLQWNRFSPYRLDVDDFALGLAGGLKVSGALGAAEVQALERAVEAYRGEFLQGFGLADSAAFEEWMVARREQWHQGALHALHALAAHALDAGHPEQAHRYAQRQLELDRWREEAYRQAMQALALGGQRGAALALYEQARQRLADELGVEPYEQTVALAEQIRAGEWDPPQVVEPRRTMPRPALPLSLTPFVGREAELTALGERLRDPAYRLVTLVGEGGIGKTRLALAAATEVTDTFADGAWFVALADLPAPGGTTDLPDTLASAIASALRFPFAGRDAPATQLRNFLRHKEALLVLDNFESALDGADLVLDLLQAAPGLTVLATSRQRLGFQAEWLVRLEGLPVPDPSDPDAAHFASVQLFAERAARVGTGWALDEATLLSVVDICRAVEGMPLAIELAAAWVGRMALDHIAATLRDTLDLLATTLRDLPPRHRSVRAVFEGSWQLLDDGEQTTLAQLSIFRGGFSAAAAQTVTGATPALLARLVDRGLVQPRADDRFTLHELLRLFAAEKLASEATLAARHRRFFLGRVREQAAALFGADSRAAQDQTRLELENVRAAWRNAQAEGDVAALDGAIAGLSRFCALAGLLREGSDLFAPGTLGVGALREGRALRGRLLAEQARFLVAQFRLDEAETAAAEAIALADDLGDAALEAEGRSQRGQVWVQASQLDQAQDELERARQGARAIGLRAVEADSLFALAATARQRSDFAASRALLEQALYLYEALGDLLNQVETLRSLGAILYFLGEGDAGRALLEQSLDLCRALGYRATEYRVLLNLGSLCAEFGDYEQAEGYFAEALEMARELGAQQIENMALSNLGLIAHHLGQRATARARFEQALALCRALGDREGEAWGLTYLALLAHQAGRNDQARRASQQALTLAEEVKDRLVASHARMILGHALTAQSQFPAATDAYGRAYADQTELEHWHSVMETLAGLARVALAQGDLAQARAHVEEILALLETHALEGAFEPFRVPETAYTVLRAARDDRAGAVLQTAHTQLHEQAARINDASVRRAFLQNVAAHAAIEAAWEEVAGEG